MADFNSDPPVDDAQIPKQPPEKSATTNFRRPTATRPVRHRAPPHDKERFKTETLSGKLWYPECQSKDEFTGEIPLEFSSIEEYIAIFDPLVLDEAREGLKADWAENCAGDGKLWRVEEIVAVEPLSNGWALVNIKVHARDGQQLNRALALFPSNTVVVLTLGKPPAQRAIEWIRDSSESMKRKKRRLLEKKEGEKGGDEEEEGQIQNVATMSGGYSSPHSSTHSSRYVKVVAGLVDNNKNNDGNGSLITSQHNTNERSNLRGVVRIRVRSVCSKHSSQNDGGGIHDATTDDGQRPPCCTALDSLVRNSRGWWVAPAGMLTTSEREYDAVHGMRSIDEELRKHILKPRLLAEIGKHYNDEVRRLMWPRHAGQEKFREYLRSKYDMTQLKAIEMTACHLGNDTAATATATAANNPHPTGASTSAVPVVPPTSPFVLIQGPPGTGKTHTVQGVLNVWHLVAYQRYYQRLHHQLVESSSARHLELIKTASKPRLLVCAPSNAACDELLTRVMQEGFCDGNGQTYYPDVVRVGADDSVLAQQVRGRSLNSLIEGYKKMSYREWSAKCTQYGMQKGIIEQDLRALEHVLYEKQHHKGQEADVLATNLLNKLQQSFRIQRKLKRLEIAQPFITGAGMKEQRNAEMEMETLLLMEAEMVFTTLSSTHRKVFKEVSKRAPFQTVLIDEAGQSSEVAALQPLCFGAKQVVLVGDPQQLPATIRSEAAKSVAMERSLFERLQSQGCPVELLTMQYRMHPQIRSFPSRYFYQNQLQDAPSVTALPPESYHSLLYCKPYLFFDVSSGKEERGKERGGSLGNVAEAELAASLFAYLRAFLIKERSKQPAGAPKHTSVAVITPYREQRHLLRETFKRICQNPDILEHVAIETVDSYQGRQVDVVMLSCVRAGVTGGSLGFVKDVRRMNVAITRARRSLWILGSVATLQGDKEWKELIQDAERRDLVIHNARAESLFSDLDYWQEQKLQHEQKKDAATGGTGAGDSVATRKKGKYAERRTQGAETTTGEQQPPRTNPLPHGKATAYPTLPMKR